MNRSKYLENDIDDLESSGNRKSDIIEGGETVWNVDGINIIRTGRAGLKPEPKENNIEGGNIKFMILF